MALPVAGVSVGNTLRVGNATIRNVSWTIAPEGINSGKVSFQSAVYFAGQTGSTVWFAFDQPYTKPPTLNVAFTFGGDLPLAGVSGGEQTRFGTTRLTKAAYDFTPTAWDSAVIPKPKVYYSGANGATVDFPFTGVYDKPAQLNTPFYFGGDPVVSGVSAGLQTRFGLIQDVRKPLQISPTGFNRTLYGRPRAGATGSIDFVFTGTYTAPTALNTPYYFGGSLPIVAGGYVFTKFGNARARKVAQDFTPTGWDSATIGTQRAYFKGQTGGDVNFPFMSPYVKPNTLNVPFYFTGDNNPYPFGFDFLSMGTGTISFRIRTVAPFGYRPTFYGRPNVENDIEFAIDVRNRGISSTRFGQPSVYTLRQVIAVFNTGSRFGAFGLPEIYINQPRNINASGLLATGFGTTAVTHYYQYVQQRTPYSGHTFGTAFVAYRVRSVTVVGDVYLVFGKPGVGFRAPLIAGNIDSLRTGVPGVEFGNVLQPQGADSLAMGSALLTRSPRYLQQVQRDESLVFGTARAYNLRQYVTQIYDADYDKLFNRGFGVYSYIFNRNRQVGPFGWLSQRFAITHLVENKAHQIKATSVPETTEPRAAQVAYRIRSLPAQGWDSMFVGRFGIVYNNARVLRPSGWDSAFVAPPTNVYSNRRTIRHHSGPTTEWGAPFIAYRVRSLTVSAGRDFLRAGYPNVSLYERYIGVDGQDYLRLGAVNVLGPFRKIIAPRWVWKPNAFGEATVRNKIPQAFLRGFDTLATGVQHRIDFRVRQLAVQGFGPDTRFGQAAIRDRKQTLELLGFDSMRVSPLARILLDRLDLPTVQTLYNVGRIGAPEGQYPADNEVGVPTVQGNPQPEGINSLRMGLPWIRVQGCVTIWDWPSSQFSFGTPTIAKPRVLEHKQNLPATEWGMPRFSPHRIWATTETPQQAIDNHPPHRPYELIDANAGNNYNPGPYWGQAVVTLRNRRIFQSHNGESGTVGGWVGNHKIENRLRYVRPEGWNSQRFGFAELPVTKELWVAPINSLQIGDHKIETPPYTGPYYAYPPGLLSQQFGATRAELKNRPVYPQGFVATQWGNNIPMVHFPRRVYPNGYIATQSGNAVVGHRIRNVYPQGFDAFQCTYTIGDFDSRMRVRRATTPFQATGFNSLAAGTPTIQNKTLRIYPYQIQGSKCLGHDVYVTHGG